MKKMIILLTFLFVSLSVSSQVFVSAEFFVKDGQRYFKLNNLSSTVVSGVVGLFNEELNQLIVGTTSLTPGGYLILGPDQSWIWQSGEKLLFKVSACTFEWTVPIDCDFSVDKSYGLLPYRILPNGNASYQNNSNVRRSDANYWRIQKEDAMRRLESARRDLQSARESLDWEIKNGGSGVICQMRVNASLRTVQICEEQVRDYAQKERDCLNSNQ